MLILQFASWLFTAVGLFLSFWIVIPAPTYPLLILGVGAPEVSPWLIILNAIALVINIVQLNQSWWQNTVFGGSLLALCLSILPLIQFSSINQQFATQMERVLGKDYLQKIPETTKLQMRRRPFIFADALRSIKLEEVRIKRGIVFASPDHVELKLNVYQPLVEGKYPALIILYGGAWQKGTATKDEKFSRYIATQGYSVIAIDYRHAPKYNFPAQLEDVRTALQYIQERAEDLEINSDRIALMGRSAGGQLASLIAYQDVLPVKALVNYYAPSNLPEGYYDLPVPDPLKIRNIMHDFIGGTPEELPELYRQASPINYVKPNLPPSLLVYVGRDRIVQSKFGKRLHKKLQEYDNRAIFLKIPWADHAFDTVFSGVSSQLALYYTERFLAWALKE